MNEKPFNREAEDFDPGFKDGGGATRLPRERTLPPRGPKKFRVEKAGNGVRCVITDWSHEPIVTSGTGAVEYHVYWAADVDMTTAAGVTAGFTRALLLSPAIPAAGIEDHDSAQFYSDPKYLTGYFYCVGVDPFGTKSEPTTPVRLISGAGGTIPPDVEHFVASESGEQHNLMTFSSVAYTFRIPSNGGDTDKVQFFYKHYPTLNEISGGETVRVTCGVGGTQTGKIRLPVARRVGSGTISIAGTAVTGVGTEFHAIASIDGDYLEVFGLRYLIASVTDKENMTLAVAWGGPTASGVSDYVVIGSVVIYAIAEGIAGARREDIENGPSQRVLLDGVLSTPVSPSLTATKIGNAIRIEITPPAGTQLARILLYRATGSGIVATKANYKTIHAFEIDNHNVTQTFLFDDSKFTTFQKEDGQVFCYTATAVNVRDQESLFSAVVEQSCKLDTTETAHPSIPSNDNMRNLLFNGFIGGDGSTVGGTANVVDDTDSGGAGSQEIFNNIRSNDGANTLQAPQTHANVGTGASRIAAWSLWKYVQTGGATAYPVHINNNEVKFPPPGAGKDIRISQYICAYSHATAAHRKIQKAAYYTLQAKIRYVTTQPNGTFYMGVSQYYAAFAGQTALLRARQSDDTFAEVSGFYSLVGSEITSDWMRLWATFHLDDSYQSGSTDKILISFIHADSTSGDIYIKEVMLNDGLILAPWTPDMGNVDWYFPVAGSPSTGPIGDPPGDHGPWEY